MRSFPFTVLLPLMEQNLCTEKLGRKLLRVKRVDERKRAMYFPKEMTFQYFFFDTYVGYFLQALPFSLLAGLLAWIFRFRKEKGVSTVQKFFSCLFVCYLTGLVCLVAGLQFLQIFWYTLFYRAPSGLEISFFSGSFSLVPDFFHFFTQEQIGNFLMFLPFGPLYLLSWPHTTGRKTMLTGVSVVLLIELLQPVFGRMFDINDVILNTAGVVVSTGIFWIIKRACTGKTGAVHNRL